MTTNELRKANYHETANKQFLLGLWAHVPVSLLTAYLAGQSLSQAIILSLAIVAGPTLFVLRDPARLVTSIANAVALVSFSALLIYLSGGMTELHFHIFASFGIMIVLAEPLAVLAALIFVVVHHVGFFFLLPSYLVNYQASFGILVIHAIFALAIAVPAIFISQKFKLYIVGVKDIIGEMQGVADGLMDTSSDMLENSQKLSGSTAQEAAAIHETSASLEELSAMIAKNSDNANLASETTTHSKQHSSKALEVMNTVVRSLGDIQHNSNAISEISDQNNRGMESIIKLIQEICEKTKVINDIVFQTKLLSFNASVEAARAGENGKGFAVVAEEVGKLASMSGASANEISQLLSRSLESVKSTIDESKRSIGQIISDGRVKIEGGVQIAESCKLLIEKIDLDLNLVSQAATEIASASKEQSQGVSEISRAMTNVGNASQENTIVANKATEIADTLSNGATELNQALEKLMKAVDQKQNRKEEVAGSQSKEKTDKRAA